MSDQLASDLHPHPQEAPGQEAWEAGQEPVPQTLDASHPASAPSREDLELLGSNNAPGSDSVSGTIAPDAARPSERARWIAIAALALILLSAFALRVWHVDWADGQLPHPDERSTVAFYAPSIRWPQEGISPLDPRQSPLNPLWDVNRQERRSYTYGHFPLYLLVLSAQGLHELAPVAERLGASPELVQTLRTANGVPGYAIVGRLLMAIADTFTVLLVFLLANRIYRAHPFRRPRDDDDLRSAGPWWVGLLAAAFSAFTVLQIQLSHFFAVDPISTTFTLLALYGSLRMLEAFPVRHQTVDAPGSPPEPVDALRSGARSLGPAMLWAIVAGVGAGLAIASKFSALPILAAPVVAGLLVLWRGRRRRSTSPERLDPSSGDRAAAAAPDRASAEDQALARATQLALPGQPDSAWIGTESVRTPDEDSVLVRVQPAATAEVSGTGGPANAAPAAGGSGAAGGRPLASLGPVLLVVFLALLVAVLVFAVTSPFAILDWENFSRAVLVEQGGMVRGDGDFPWTRQYRGTLPYLYFIEQQVRFGIGWPLGILAFLSLGWALLKLVLGKARDGEIIILSWIVPYFGLTGLFLAKFMRYMVPVTPLLMVFAAGLVAAVATCSWQRVRRAPSAVDGLPSSGARSARCRFGPYLAAAIGGIALVGAISWSLAYVNGVYADTHPWIKASRWIYANIPDGATIAWEFWDDSLPYDLPEPNSNRGRYNIIAWGPFEEDTPEKFEQLKQTFRRADYLALASNRIYGAVDNLPERYPMTNRYYDLLFAGELGYELALEVVNHPRLLGIEFSEQGADESFTLYDHPRVLVFRKVRDLSDAEWERLLGGSWEGARPWYVGPPTLIQRLWAIPESILGGLGSGTAQAPPAPSEPGPDEGASLLLDQPLDQLPVVQDFRWNGLASRSPPLAVLFWWIAISLLGLVTWPLAFALFDNLRDRGYLLSRSLGWLLVGYAVWLAASVRVGRNTLPFILLAIGLLALLSLWLWRRNRREMAFFWRSHRKLLLFGEGLLALSYLFFVLLRIGNPDIWQPWNGGEKFMEFAFLNAILRSANFPPVDPYFAGGTINYYYYGHYLVGLLTKLTGIWSSVAFNLAIPTLFALTVGNVFSLGYSLAGRLPLRKPMALPSARMAAIHLQPPGSPGDETTASPDPFVVRTESAEALTTNPESVEALTRNPDEAGGAQARAARVFSPRWLWHGVGGGLLAALFVAVLGNVDGGGQIVRGLAAQSTLGFESNLPGLQTTVRALDGLVQVMGPAALAPYRYWDPSRVIPYTINEFPYWSFLFADLHPHMIGIPFTVLFLALAFNLLGRYGQTQGGRTADMREDADQIERPGHSVLAWAGRVSGYGLYLVMALVLGALAVINTWDLPTYFGLAVLSWLVREWRRGRLAEQPGRALLRTLAFAAALLIAAIGLYLPFFLHYEPLASSGLGIVQVKTDLGQWLNIWGFLGFLVVTLILVELRRRPARAQAGSWSRRELPFVRWLRVALNHFPRLPRLYGLTPLLSRRGLIAIIVVVILAVLLWLLDFRVPAVLLLPLAGALVLLLRRTVAVENLFLAILVFTGLLVLLGVEFVYLKDHLQGGEFRRMNTLFKFYIQVWVLLALAVGVGLPRMWRFVQTRWRPGWRIAWVVAFVWLLALSLVFPLAGTPARLDDRFPRQMGRPPIGTLDGMAYMTVGTYTWHPDPAQAPNTTIELRHDYEALRWLLDNVSGTPVVAEAVIGYYREGGLRVASFTGFPTLLGFHQEGEQRYGWQTGPRRARAEEFWNTLDLERARQLIEELAIDYIYVGQLERIVVSAEGLAKFQQLAQQGMLEEVFRNERVVIYHVVE